MKKDLGIRWLERGSFKHKSFLRKIIFWIEVFVEGLTRISCFTPKEYL